MLCPTDGAALVMSERSGIEIDYCPQCRGIWLDRGELDKIVERSFQQEAPRPAPQPRFEERPRYEKYDSYDKYGNQGYHKKKRKESWLSELFD